jgi:YegS/Rv2252/BmrU family lipid kinase
MNQKETIALLANPLKRKKISRKIIHEIVNVLNGKKILYDFYQDAWPENINAFKEVWLIGGDGTVNYFLNLYKNISIPIAIFKGGTGNDFAATLYGGAITATEQANYLLSAPIRLVDAGTCNHLVFINGVGFGFDGEVVRSIKSIRWIGGHLGYLIAVIKQVFFFKEIHFKIQSGPEAIDEQLLLCLVCNSTHMGGGFTISPTSKIDDGLLNVILCKPLSLLKRIKYLPVIEKGQHIGLDFIHHFSTTEMKISCKQKIYIQLDGELYRGKEFDITIMPKRYSFKY